MIKNYNEFINEYYTGPYRSAGFKNYEPSDKFNFDLHIKFDNNNEKIIKDILSKYDIPYDNLELETPNLPIKKTTFFSKKAKSTKPESQKLKLTFISYNKYEAVSIINSILSDLHQNGIMFDPSTINIEPSEKTIKKPIGFQFPEKEI